MTRAIDSLPVEMKIDDVADFLGITAERIRQYQKIGACPRGTKRGVVPFRETVCGILSALRDANRQITASPSSERVRLARASEIEKRSRDEKSRANADGRLRRGDDMVFGALKSALVGIPANVTRDLSMRLKFENAVDAALEKAADQIDAFSENLTKSHFASAPDAKAPSPPPPQNRAARRAAAKRRR